MTWVPVVSFAVIVATVCWCVVRIGALEDRVKLLANKVEYLLDGRNEP